MVKKSALIIVALMVLVVVVSGCLNTNYYETNTDDDGTNTDNYDSNQTPTNDGSSSADGDIISPEEAKAIAEKFNDVPGEFAGIPELITVDGNQIYVVPFFKNGENVGEIEIDAVTGENIGGAGGAP